MSGGAALRRLKKEYATLDKERPPGVLIVRPLETNFLHAHFLLAGEAFYDMPYEGGVYHGVLKFPSNYPMGPPAVIMRTPSGRFQPDQKICFSMSDFHKEEWNPMWNIGTILTGLVSFMNGEDITTGGMRATASARRQFAQQSLRHNMQQDALAKELFASALEDVVTERAKHGNVWPPVRPPPTVQPSKQAAAAVSAGKRVSARRPKRAKSKGVVSNDTNDLNKKAEPEPVAAISNKPPDTTGKNAAKNKKKREREKRKKLARTFLTNLRETTPKFLDAVLAALDKLGGSVSHYPADHVCWRTESMEEYNDLVTALRGATDDTQLLIESEIGGRSIATFELLEPIQYNDGRSIPVVEIPAPKDGRPYKRGLEHVEFVIGDDENDNGGTVKSIEEQKLVLEDFMNKYPAIEWNTKAIDKPVNADVSLQVELGEDFGVCSIKFHLLPLSKVVECEKEGTAGIS